MTPRRRGARPGDKRKLDPARTRGRGRARRATGTLALTRQSLAFVDLDSGGPGIIVSLDALGDAVHGDRVEVEIARQPRGRRAQGVISQVLERTERRLSGTLALVDGIARFDPGRGRYVGGDFEGTPPDLERIGERCVALLLGGSNPGAPRYRFIEFLSDGLDPLHDSSDIAHELGIPLVMPARVSKYAEERASAPIDDPSTPRRLDLSDRHCLTIDPDDAQDFDDALSWRQLPGGHHEVGIHIADVTWYVEEGDPVDVEARQRGTSAYLPGLTVHMLPSTLSAGSASLRPDVERATLSLLVTLDADARVIEWTLARAAIRSRRRFTYGDAQRILDGDRGEDSQHAEALEALHGIASTMRRSRLERALDLDIPEYEAILDSTGAPLEFKVRESGAAHHLVEEFMLLANRLIGGWGLEARLPIVYRVHEKPRWERLLELAQVLEQLGIRSTGRNLSKPKVLEDVLREAGERNLRSLASIHLLRALEKAEYSADDVGHYGLGMKGYCHFTSPIRRYPDLHTHRVVMMAVDALGGGDPASRQRDDADRLLTTVRRHFRGDAVATMAAAASARERIAQRAERLALRVKVLRALADQVGQVLRGMITNVTGGGFYVQLDDYPIDGFIPRDRLPGDGYRLGSRSQSLEGRRGSSGFGLGQRVEVHLDSVSVVRREFELTLAAGARRSGRDT